MSLRRASAKARGYGARHKALRKAWSKRVEAGEVRCARCGKWIRPDEPWDLGHDDFDRSRWTGPEHRGCNRAWPWELRRRREAARQQQTGDGLGQSSRDW